MRDISETTPLHNAEDLVRYEWTPRGHWYHRSTPACQDPDAPCPQDAFHLLIWHNCRYVLPQDSVAPGEFYGWRGSGAGLHTVITPDPLTVTASIYFPECCGLHGWITGGIWFNA